VPLLDIALSTISNLGQVAEVLATGADRARYGNEVYGAFGRDFITSDRIRIMVMAITPRQWAGLLKALDIADAVARIEAERGVSFCRDEGTRFEHREILIPLVENAIAGRASDNLFPMFDRLGVCWGLYRTVHEAVMDPELIRNNPIFTDMHNPSGLTYPVAGAPATLSAADRMPPCPAPRLGEHTEEVLASVIGLGAREIGRLHDAGIVASPNRQSIP
jgi:2-methylfumaryl-CoA isomerase